MKKEEINKLFRTDLEYLYNMELQVSRLLPRIEKYINSGEIKKFSKENIESNVNQIDRIRQIFEILQKRLKGRKSLGMVGMIEECSEILEKAKKSESLTMEVSLLASLQRIKHYQIGAYESLALYSNILGEDKFTELLNKNLVDERRLNNDLKKLVKKLVLING